MSSQSATFALLGQVARYTEALARDPQSTAFVPLAETFRQCGLLVEALAVAEKGAQTLPAHAPGYIVLARIQAQLGQQTQALASFEAALALDEGNVDALMELARLCASQGQTSRARVLLTRVLSANPGDETAGEMLASLPADPAPPPVVTISRGAIEKGAAALKDESKPSRGGRVTIDAGGPISTATIAEIYVRQGFTLRALKVYRDLLQADPHNEEIRRKLVALKERIEREEGEKPSDPVDIEAIVTKHPSAPAQTSSVGGAPSALGGELRILAQLEKWLTAIEQRRGNV